MEQLQLVGGRVLCEDFLGGWRFESFLARFLVVGTTTDTVKDTHLDVGYGGYA